MNNFSLPTSFDKDTDYFAEIQRQNEYINSLHVKITTLENESKKNKAVLEDKIANLAQQLLDSLQNEVQKGDLIIELLNQISEQDAIIKTLQKKIKGPSTSSCTSVIIPHTQFHDSSSANLSVAISNLVRSAGHPDTLDAEEQNVIAQLQQQNGKSPPD